MVGSPPHQEERGEGTPVRVRDGPAAVRGDALPPPHHWPRGPGRRWEGVAPSQKTCCSPSASTPSRKGEGEAVMSGRLALAAALAVFALALAVPSLAATKPAVVAPYPVTVT